MLKFDLILPKKRMGYQRIGKKMENVQNYLIPLLFPKNKPKFSNSSDQQCFDNISLMKYYFPFKP